MNLVQHYEEHLGPIREGWVWADPDEDPGFQVISLERAPVTGAAVFATLGVSDYPVRSRASGKEIRQELVMLVPERLGPGNVPGLLRDVGREVVESGTALLRGDVLGPRGPLFRNSQLEALYVAIPVYFPETFAACETEGGTIVIAWLVPITAAEAEYVATHGWSAFEDEMAEQDPDLLDFTRHGLRLC